MPGSSFSAFWQGHFSVFGPQSRSILPIKTHFAVPKAKSTVLWSLEPSLVFWLQNYEPTPQSEILGKSELGLWGHQKKPPPQPMNSIIRSCIFESPILFQKSVLILSQPPEFQLSGGVVECCAFAWVVEPLLALGFSSHVLVFWWGEKPCEAPRRPSPLGTSRLGEVVKSTRPRLMESPYLPRNFGPEYAVVA